MPQTAYTWNNYDNHDNWHKWKKAETTYDSSTKTLPNTVVLSYFEKVFPDTNMKMSSLTSVVQNSRRANTRILAEAPSKHRQEGFVFAVKSCVYTNSKKNKYDNRRLLRFFCEFVFMQDLAEMLEKGPRRKVSRAITRSSNITHARWNILKRYN